MGGGGGGAKSLRKMYSHELNQQWKVREFYGKLGGYQEH